MLLSEAHPRAQPLSTACLSSRGNDGVCESYKQLDPLPPASLSVGTSRRQLEPKGSGRLYCRPASYTGESKPGAYRPWLRCFTGFHAFRKASFFVELKPTRKTEKNKAEGCSRNIKSREPDSAKAPERSLTQTTVRAHTEYNSPAGGLSTPSLH